MGEGQGQERARQLSDDPDEAAAQLRTEIEEVREDLGDTTAALAAKTDVKTRAREKAEELKRTAAGKKDELLGGRGGGAQPGAGGAGTTAGSGLQQLQTKARENPVPTAALAALAGGILIGRLTRRQP